MCLAASLPDSHVTKTRQIILLAPFRTGHQDTTRRLIVDRCDAASLVLPRDRPGSWRGVARPRRMVLSSLRSEFFRLEEQKSELQSPYVNSYSAFFFNDTATTEIYPLSLHDALPISSEGPTRLVARRGSPSSYGALQPSLRIL